MNVSPVDRYNLKTGDEEHKYVIQKGEQTAVLNFIENQDITLP